MHVNRLKMENEAIYHELINYLCVFVYCLCTLFVCVGCGHEIKVIVFCSNY